MFHDIETYQHFQIWPKKYGNKRNTHFPTHTPTPFFWLETPRHSAEYIKFPAAFFNLEELALRTFQDTVTSYTGRQASASAPVVAWIQWNNWYSRYELSQAGSYGMAMGKKHRTWRKNSPDVDEFVCVYFISFSHEIRRFFARSGGRETANNNWSMHEFLRLPKKGPYIQYIHYI